MFTRAIQKVIDGLTRWTTRRAYKCRKDKDMLFLCGVAYGAAVALSAFVPPRRDMRKFTHHMLRIIEEEAGRIKRGGSF